MRLELKFSEQKRKIEVGFSQSKNGFQAKFQHFQQATERKEVDYYEGTYKVVPKVTEQKLETRQKFLIEDVIVKEIPYFDVSNESGGSTVYIGNEV